MQAEKLLAQLLPFELEDLEKQLTLSAAQGTCNTMSIHRARLDFVQAYRAGHTLHTL